MHPVLFQLGPLQVRAYGLALAVSFLLGSWLALRRGRARGMNDDDLLGLFWWIVISSIIGARLHYVLAHPDQFAGLLDALRIWGGGLILYGGLIAAVLASWIYTRRKRMSFLQVADVIAPSLALGEGVTRLGCFFNGCCFGDLCTSSLGIRVPPDSYAAHAVGQGAVIWPSQLFLSAALLGALVILLLVDRRPGPGGGLFGLYLMLQGFARYAIDFTRWYEPGDQVHLFQGLIRAHSQVVAVVLFLLGLVLFARRRTGRTGPAGAGG